LEGGLQLASRPYTTGRKLLTHARELIASSWTQHAEARNADGLAVDPWDPDAVSWSLLGALVAGYERDVWISGPAAALEELVHTCLLLGDILDSDSLEEWNDAAARCRRDVLDALDDAAAGADAPPP
jgi:hypothetical protein